MSNVGGAILCAALLTIVGRAGVSSTSRTGVFRDVRLEERMTPTSLQVQAGDEVAK